MPDVESIVRTYLTALKDPSTLRDDAAITAAENALDAEGDAISRLRLREELKELTSPSLESVEEDFVTHAKSWADSVGISAESFLAEGVGSAVLRRAGFSVGRGGRRPAGRRSARREPSGGRRRVSAEEVAAAIPDGTFTVNALQEASGASIQVVRKVVKSEVAEGRVSEVGPDPDHEGPGRAPVLYRKG